MKKCHDCRFNFSGRCVSHDNGFIYDKFKQACIEEDSSFTEDCFDGCPVDIYGVPCLYIENCFGFEEVFPFLKKGMTVLHPDCFTELMDRFNQGCLE